MIDRLTRRAAIAAAMAWTALALGAAAPDATPLPKAKPSVPAVKTARPPEPETGRSIAEKIGVRGNQGWMVVDLGTGEVLEADDAGRAFAPASVAKLPTAFYALDTLGAGHRFETVVAAAGVLKGETLEGDLVLIGAGDPELDTDALEPLVRRTIAAGIRNITGRFLVDASAGPRIVELDPEQPADVTYNPSLTGLNLNYNRVRLEWDAGKGEAGLDLLALGERLAPPARSFEMAIDPRPDAPVFTHEFGPQGEVWRMAKRAFRGTGSRWLPVRQPELYAAQVFRDLAGEAGLTLPAPTIGNVPEGAATVARHEGRPLTQVIYDMLKWSTNLTAEALGVRATAERTGAVPETLFASAAAMNGWAAEVAAFPTNDPAFRFANHSGLSTVSRVSPQRMVDLLRVIAAREPAANHPMPRIPGALSGLLKAHNIRDEGVSFPYQKTAVAAKTGTMNYVRGLAGFITTPEGRELAFAYFANDIAARETWGTSVDRNWLAKARRLERSLIRHWVRLADSQES
ncbi:MAG TPA: D-alanyl-D-alanine carboxypeptidase/D-alanyl-D-alanine-endopeptidase [Thermohalobaculum sp.]|nr:D-alanyl-D-alanine carboxypeptidase/D-alanyl-D-alanine-endopeptidase [Thermohalobaculum sp.]